MGAIDDFLKPQSKLLILGKHHAKVHLEFLKKVIMTQDKEAEAHT